MKASIDVETAKRIIKFGKHYTPALLPPDLRRGRVGWCFDDCIIQLTNEFLATKYRYVEGIAMDTLHYRETGEESWVLHAWLTDGKYAYDPTWQAFDDDNIERPCPTVYIGIEMDRTAVMRFMASTKYQGVISNGWRNKALARAALPDGFRITRGVHNLTLQQAAERQAA